MKYKPSKRVLSRQTVREWLQPADIYLLVVTELVDDRHDTRTILMPEKAGKRLGILEKVVAAAMNDWSPDDVCITTTVASSVQHPDIKLVVAQVYPAVLSDEAANQIAIQGIETWFDKNEV